MGELDRSADGAEEPKAFPHLRHVPLAERRDRLSLDVLHDEIGKPVIGIAAVKKAGDVGVVEAGEDLPFLTELAENEIGVGPTLDDLDRHALPVLLVGASGEVDVPHPPAPEQGEDFVRDRCASPGRGTARQVRARRATARERRRSQATPGNPSTQTPARTEATRLPSGAPGRPGRLRRGTRFSPPPEGPWPRQRRPGLSASDLGSSRGGGELAVKIGLGRKPLAMNGGR